MKITIDDLEAFIAVADFESFNRAANELGITQPALSRRIKKLEETLGARLLDRTTRKISVSIVGEEFILEARRMLDEFNKSIDDVQELIKTRTGSISLTTNMTIANSILPDIVYNFKKKNPNIRLRISQDSSPEAVIKVLRRECEFAIAQYNKDDPELEFEPLINDCFEMVCHKKHPLAKAENISWKDFESYNFIKLGSKSRTMSILENELLEQIGYIKGDIEVDHFSALIGLVEKNLGVSAIPSLAKFKRPESDLITRPINNPTVSRMLGIVTYKGRSLSPASKAFCELLKAKIKKFA
ncbi:LysR family transcriptional regulator [Arcobacter sp. CECT 8983]|uniref:LysR family transcriptional regulator n=1 Tax=Arcobacter sp. CECT 8983 TaxID=2044508 RepID=UPI00100AC4A7|nr:LysR family transcriptional regulator [Arcobacter sp. CECT 8983]RXJ89741.1 LysR family transcriptional regulator [Arcobacter sp. CECT 8983]